MTADSNYEIKKDGAQVLLSLAGQSCHPGRFIESVVLSGSKEKNREIKSLTNKAVIRLGENYGPEVVVTELARLLPKSAMSSQQTEEISNLLTILLLKMPSNDLAVEMCPLLPLIFNDYAQKTVQSGVELASLIGSIVTKDVELLLTALDSIERPEGSVYIKQSVLGRIRMNKVPSLDQDCLIGWMLEHIISFYYSSISEGFRFHLFLIHDKLLYGFSTPFDSDGRCAKNECHPA